jgi:hypothetical protein
MDPKYKILVAIDAASTVKRKVFFKAVLVLPQVLLVFLWVRTVGHYEMRYRGNEQK